MKKLLALLVCATICVGSMTACQSTPAENQSAQTQQTQQMQTTDQEKESSDTKTSDNYPLTITTYNYEKEQVEYTFDKAPERVWAQNQNNIETLLALGLGDQIVGACGLDGEIREDLRDEF